MRRLIAALGLLFTVGGAVGGCYVAPAAPGRCPGGYWVEGHYGPRGRWHPGHWRCPGIVEIE